MSFKDWTPLQLVDSDLLSRVCLAYVFGEKGCEALIVTDEDEVLACGKNQFGCLGLGNEECQTKPVCILELSKKRIKGFAATITENFSLVCALTSSGTIYYWGRNSPAVNITTKPSTFPEFSKKVSEVACGNAHCAILTTEGEVFCFGRNYYGQLGNGTNDDLNTPTLVQGGLKGKLVVAISCGSHFSVCVLDNGAVYAWGSNCSGQLGWNPEFHSPSNSPIRVPELNNIIVRKIVCGSGHVLAINDASELFSWGCNHVGQLGSGNNTNRYKPTKIETIGKVIDIAAIGTRSTSAAMTENSDIFMWGTCLDLHLNVPTKTKFETMHEVFAYFSDPKIMHKPMGRLSRLESVGETIKYSFGDAETSDLTIVAEDKEILVHKLILKLRSNYFKSLLQEPWVKEDAKLIKIDQNYEGIYAYLKYIYTGHLEATPEVALELLKIADEYNDLVLKKICERSIEHGITKENVARLYNFALKLRAEILAESCVSFLTNHMGEVIKTTDFTEWDKDTCQEFIVECYKRKMFRS